VDRRPVGRHRADTHPVHEHRADTHPVGRRRASGDRARRAQPHLLARPTQLHTAQLLQARIRTGRESPTYPAAESDSTWLRLHLRGPADPGRDQTVDVHSWFSHCPGRANSTFAPPRRIAPAEMGANSPGRGEPRRVLASSAPEVRSPASLRDRSTAPSVCPVSRHHHSTTENRWAVRSVHRQYRPPAGC
jgi:hypothetical protein